MKIGTYNLQFLFDAGTRLHSGKEYDFPKEFVEKRFDYFAKEFEKLDADILFLQELGDESALTKVLDRMKTPYKHFVAKPDTFGVGNAVIYKKDLNCSCTSLPTNAPIPKFHTDDPDTLGDRIWSRRDYVQVETIYQKKALHLIGVHIKANFWLHEYDHDTREIPEDLSQADAADGIIRSELFRFSQVKKLRITLDAIFDEDPESQVMIMGDFNATPGNKILNMIAGGFKKKPTAMVQALEQIPEKDRFSIIFPGAKVLIDHIFVSQELNKKIAKMVIHNKELIGQGGNPNKPFIVESDHAAITVELD